MILYIIYNYKNILGGALMAQIRDLYAGKPDAKDEIKFEGFDGFIKSFVVAEHFNFESLLSGTNYLITGFKGTGKTALLFYLENELKNRDESTCASFIFFKDEYANTRREELHALSKRILSSVTLQSGVLVDNTEFEYIWRWLFLKRIVSDNEDCNKQLFVDNNEWYEFERMVGAIKAPSDKKRNIVPQKFKLVMPVEDTTTGVGLAPEVEVDLQKTDDKNYREFVNLIDKAESQFSKLKRTEIPYYIFVDELEAYYGDENLFKRDLGLIRDLIFTVKRFNTVFVSENMDKTKVFCSVRSEIVNAITRFLVTREINKATVGFSVPLIWNYDNTSSYRHPVMQILLKRIAMCEENENPDYKEIYSRWFPEKIHGIEPANYILNNGWCKPRDIVRLITVSQNSIDNKQSVFSQHLFNDIAKAYSEGSLNEIEEELRALYDPRQIDIIISCFRGYKTVFSYNQLKARVEKFYAGTILQNELSQIVADLYRLGFLGNFLPLSKSYRWQHKGDDGVIIADEWRLVIHYALHSALSIGARQNYGLSQGIPPEIGDVVEATIRRRINKFALVTFQHNGKEYKGRISINELRNEKDGVPEVYGSEKEPEVLQAVVKSYVYKFDCWNLKPICFPE